MQLASEVRAEVLLMCVWAVSAELQAVQSGWMASSPDLWHTLQSWA